MNINRHAALCSVCQHEEREAIEAEYLAYRPVDETAAKYGLNRDAIYRHAAALSLVERRQSNLTGLCAWIIERGQKERVEITPSLLAAAVAQSAKLQGLIVDRSVTLDLTRQLEQASDSELDFFTVHGRLPKPAELAAAPDAEQ